MAEYFREGEEPFYGGGAILDGGFAMGSNLPMFAPEGTRQTQEVVTSTGRTIVVPEKANVGTVTAGGLY